MPLLLSFETYRISSFIIRCWNLAKLWLTLAIEAVVVVHVKPGGSNVMNLDPFVCDAASQRDFV